MNHLLKQSLASLAIAAALIPVAGAQAPAQGEARQRPAQSQRQAFSLPSERVEARLAYQKTALKITDAQNAQWNAYADVQRRHAREMDQRVQEMRARRQAAPGAQGAPAPQAQRPTLIERLERRQAMLATAAKHLNEQLVVQKPLYAALSTEQKQVADRLLAAGPGRGGFGDGARGGRRGMQHHGMPHHVTSHDGVQRG